MADSSGIGTTELLLLGAAGYLAYSYFTSTGLFAPAAAAAASTTPAGSTVPSTSGASTAETSPVTTAPVVSPAPPINSNGGYNTRLWQPSWVAKGAPAPSGFTLAQWSASASYAAGDAVTYAPSGAREAGAYVNLTGNNTTTTPDKDLTNWGPLVDVDTGNADFRSHSSAGTDSHQSC